MIRTAALLVAATLGLAACNPAMEEVTGPVSKAAARAVVGPIVQEQVPGEVGAALTECILDNASQAELIQISAANAGAPANTVVLLVSDILGRQETVACATASLT